MTSLSHSLLTNSYLNQLRNSSRSAITLHYRARDPLGIQARSLSLVSSGSTRIWLEPRTDLHMVPRPVLLWISLEILLKGVHPSRHRTRRNILSPKEVIIDASYHMIHRPGFLWVSYGTLLWGPTRAAGVPGSKSYHPIGFHQPDVVPHCTPSVLPLNLLRNSLAME